MKFSHLSTTKLYKHARGAEAGGWPALAQRIYSEIEMRAAAGDNLAFILLYG
jgi:hypothetical protein